MVQYNTIQYNTIQYNTIQYNTIQYNTNNTNPPPLRADTDTHTHTRTHTHIQTHKELDVKAATEKVVQWERKGKYLQDIWSWGVALGRIVRLDCCGNSEGGAVGSQGQESATHLAVSPAVAVSSLASRYMRRSGNDDVLVAVCCRVLQLYRWCVVSLHQGIVILFVKGTPLTRVTTTRTTPRIIIIKENAATNHHSSISTCKGVIKFTW